MYLNGKARSRPSKLCASHMHRQFVLGGRARPKERIRKTGLEAGGAICGKRSCFKASSADHPKLTTALNQDALYWPMAYTQALFPFFLQYIYKPPLSGRQAGNSPKKSRRMHRLIVEFREFRANSGANSGDAILNQCQLLRRRRMRPSTSHIGRIPGTPYSISANCLEGDGCARQPVIEPPRKG